MKNVLDKLTTSTAINAIASFPLGPRIFFDKPDEGGSDEGEDGGEGGGEDKSGGENEGGDKGGKGKFSGKSFGGKGEAEEEAGSDEPKEGERPSHVPEKFWDPETKAVKSDDLAKAYAELEIAHGKAKRGKGIGEDLPESPEGYFGEDGLELPKEVDRLKTSPDDPGLKAWSEVAHKYGIGKEVATSIAQDMFVNMNKFADAPIDPEVEREAMGPNAKAQIEGVELWLDSLDATGVMSDDSADIAMQLSQTASGLKFLTMMRAQSGARPIPIDPVGDAAGMSPDEFNEAYKQAVKDKDYAKRAKLDAMRGAVFQGGDQNAKVNI